MLRSPLMRWKMPVECCLPDTLFLKRFLSDGDSMHHKHRSSGTGELMVGLYSLFRAVKLKDVQTNRYPHATRLMYTSTTVRRRGG